MLDVRGNDAWTNIELWQNIFKNVHVGQCLIDAPCDAQTKFDYDLFLGLIKSVDAGYVEQLEFSNSVKVTLSQEQLLELHSNDTKVKFSQLAVLPSTNSLSVKDCKRYCALSQSVEVDEVHIDETKDAKNLILLAEGPINLKIRLLIIHSTTDYNLSFDDYVTICALHQNVEIQEICLDSLADIKTLSALADGSYKIHRLVIRSLSADNLSVKYLKICREFCQNVEIDKINLGTIADVNNLSALQGGGLKIGRICILSSSTDNLFIDDCKTCCALSQDVQVEGIHLHCVADMKVLSVTVERVKCMSSLATGHGIFKIKRLNVHSFTKDELSVDVMEAFYFLSQNIEVVQIRLDDISDMKYLHILDKRLNDVNINQLTVWSRNLVQDASILLKVPKRTVEETETSNSDTNSITLIDLRLGMKKDILSQLNHIIRTYSSDTVVLSSLNGHQISSFIDAAHGGKISRLAVNSIAGNVATLLPIFSRCKVTELYICMDLEEPARRSLEQFVKVVDLPRDEWIRRFLSNGFEVHETLFHKAKMCSSLNIN